MQMINNTGIVETIPVDFYNKNERLQQAMTDLVRLFGGPVDLRLLWPAPTGAASGE